jgi:hypothetical protein
MQLQLQVQTFNKMEIVVKHPDSQRKPGEINRCIQCIVCGSAKFSHFLALSNLQVDSLSRFRPLSSSRNSQVTLSILMVLALVAIVVSTVFARESAPCHI